MADETDTSIPSEDFGADLVARYADPIDEGDADVAAQIGAALADDESSAAPDPAGEGATEAPVEPPPDSAGAPTPEEPETPPAAEGGYVWHYNEGGADTETRFSDDQVRQALYLAADQRTHQGLLLADWADKLTPEAREQLSAVSTGQAVAIPRADFDRYQAWLHQTQTASRLPADIDQYDPDAARLIREQQEQIARLEASQAPAAQQAGYRNDDMAQWLGRAYNDAIGGLKQSWQLTDGEVDALYNAARPFVASLQMQNSQYHPITHELVAPADPNDVMHKAFSFALTQNPALHAAVIARNNQSHPNPQSEQPAAAPDATVTDIAAKRARAASLASAPSAAVTPSPRSVVAMSDQELVDAMTEELARAMNGNAG